MPWSVPDHEGSSLSMGADQAFRYRNLYLAHSPCLVRWGFALDSP